MHNFYIFYDNFSKFITHYYLLGHRHKIILRHLVLYLCSATKIVEFHSHVHNRKTKDFHQIIKLETRHTQHLTIQRWVLKD